MKLAGFAIPFLLLSGAAVAQPADAPAPGTTAYVPVPNPNAPGGMSTDKITTPASSDVVQPDNSRPRIDDRGVAVRSDPAVVPPGYNGVTTSTAMGGPEEDVANVQTVPTTSAGVPACSRTITDHCAETYRQDYVAGPRKH